ncbi:MAG: hypothetical protein KAG20_04990 [Cocleimonas sp.]|nr:hypothetical protein [Cocleimonas sp.]
MRIKFSTIIPIAVLLTLTVSLQAATDNCLVGKWKPDTTQLKQQFGQMSQQMVTGVRGQVILTLNKGGTGVYQLNNFTLLMNGVAGSPMPMKMTMTMNGASRFNWSAQNRQFVMKNAKISVKTSGSIDMGGMKMPLPSLPISDQQASAGVADGKYTCSGNKLIFTPKKKGSILTLWYRM